MPCLLLKQNLKLINSAMIWLFGQKPKGILLIHIKYTLTYPLGWRASHKRTEN